MGGVMRGAMRVGESVEPIVLFASAARAQHSLMHLPIYTNMLARRATASNLL